MLQMIVEWKKSEQLASYSIVPFVYIFQDTMDIPEHCYSNETLMQIIEEKGLFDNSTAAAESPFHNYSDPVSLFMTTIPRIKAVLLIMKIIFNYVKRSRFLEHSQ